MSADLRGFTYPLEALRRRQGWQRDILERELGAAQGELTACEAEAARLADALSAAALACGASTRAYLDLGTLQAGLMYLSTLRDLADQIEHQRLALRAACDAARAACVTQHQRCEATGRHRQQSLDEYQEDQHRRGVAAADNDWIARSAWRQAAAAPTNEENR